LCSARRVSNPFGVDVPRHRWDLDQGIADLWSAAQTTELRTDGRCGGVPPPSPPPPSRGVRARGPRVSLLHIQASWQSICVE
jgi:hypothetical protein